MLSINEIARRVLYTPPAMTLGTFSHTLDLTKGHAVRAEKEMVERKARRKECSRERHSVSQKLRTSNKAAGSARHSYALHNGANRWKIRTSCSAQWSRLNSRLKQLIENIS